MPGSGRGAGRLLAQPDRRRHAVAGRRPGQGSGRAGGRLRRPGRGDEAAFDENVLAVLNSRAGRRSWIWTPSTTWRCGSAGGSGSRSGCGAGLGRAGCELLPSGSPWGVRRRWGSEPRSRPSSGGTVSRPSWPPPGSPCGPGGPTPRKGCRAVALGTRLVSAGSAFGVGEGEQALGMSLAVFGISEGRPASGTLARPAGLIEPDHAAAGRPSRRRPSPPPGGCRRTRRPAADG